MSFSVQPGFMMSRQLPSHPEFLPTGADPGPSVNSMCAQMRRSKRKGIIRTLTRALEAEEAEIQELVAGPVGWPRMRRLTSTIINSQYFDIMLGVLIMFNIVVMALEADATADGSEAPQWMGHAYKILLCIYMSELAARIYVDRVEYFKDGSNLLDVAIISIDIIFIVLEFAVGTMPSVSLLRMFRLVRLGRAVRVLVMFPELHLMVQGLVGALKALAWGSLLLTIILVFWSILAVQILHPLNQKVAATGVYGDCERCSLAFESVRQAALTFTQQIVAGDSWGQVSIPIITEYPATVLFLLPVLLSVNLAIMNLILAVIVDNAQEARQDDLHRLYQLKEKQFDDSTNQLFTFFSELDDDNSGYLTVNEFRKCYQTSKQFSDILESMDLYEDDLDMLFGVLDKDHSGSIDYSEFFNQLHKLHEVNTLLVFIKSFIRRSQKQITEDLKAEVIDIKHQLSELLEQTRKQNPNKNEHFEAPANPSITLTGSPQPPDSLHVLTQKSGRTENGSSREPALPGKFVELKQQLDCIWQRAEDHLFSLEDHIRRNPNASGASTCSLDGATVSVEVSKISPPMTGMKGLPKRGSGLWYSQNDTQPVQVDELGENKASAWRVGQAGQISTV